MQKGCEKKMQKESPLILI